MSLTDVAAIVGALAWLPPIVAGARTWITKPQIRVITQPTPEIGFTSLGPILNLRVALTVTHKDIVITGIRLEVVHESGEKAFFSWRGVVQRMGTLTYPQVGQVPFEKELNVLAMKVSLKDVEERFIRFQNLDFVKEKTTLESVALKKLAYLRQTNKLDEETFLRSQEMTELYSYTRQSFSWKPGTYRLRVLLEAPDSFDVIGDEYSFVLSPHHVQQLSENLKHIEQFYMNELVPTQQGEQLKQIAWMWVYPEMQRANG